MKQKSMQPATPERLAFLCEAHSKGWSLNIKVSDAAGLLALSVSNLNLLRLKGGGPRFQKFGRSVRYRLADVMAFTNGPTYSSTSDFSASKAKREHPFPRPSPS